MRLLWSQKSASSPRGLALARERGWLLLWDAQSTLTLLDHTGQRQALRQFAAPLVGAACADDGSCYAAVGSGGEVWLLAPDLTTRWERKVSQRGVAIALEAFGLLLAVSDGAGTVQLFDGNGATVWKADNPRPLQFLTFVAEKPVLLGSADFGLVTCFDRTGKQLWRDGLVANVGSLAVDGAGDVVALACFGDGLCCYAVPGPPPRRLAQVAPCKLAAVSYEGSLLLTTDLEGRLQLRRGEGTVGEEHKLDSPAVALTLGPLGDLAHVVQSDGTLLCLETGAGKKGR